MSKEDISSRVTIGFVNFNNRPVIEKCIDSIIALEGGPYRMIFVDNASTDGSRELVRRKYSNQLEIISLEKNEGPNPARNIILEKTETEYVLFLDADVELEKDVVVKLVEALDSTPQAAVASPKIMDNTERSVVQFSGTWIHYIGAAIHPKQDSDETFSVTSLGGACLLVKSEVAREIDGWDEDMHFGWTDGDFVFRMILAGYQALCVGSAKLYHPYRQRGLSKSFHQIRNRWYFMLKTYSWQTLVLISPMIILYEFFLFGFMIVKRQIGIYFKANFSLLGRLSLIFKKRGYVQRYRKVRDRDVLSAGDFTVREDVMGNKLLARAISLFNGFLNAYWLMIRRAC